MTGSPSRSQRERTQAREREAGDPPPSPPKKLQHHRKKETASSRVPFFLQGVCFSFWALIFFKHLVIPPPSLIPRIVYIPISPLPSFLPSTFSHRQTPTSRCDRSPRKIDTTLAQTDLTSPLTQLPPTEQPLPRFPSSSPPTNTTTTTTAAAAATATRKLRQLLFLRANALVRVPLPDTELQQQHHQVRPEVGVAAQHAFQEDGPSLW